MTTWEYKVAPVSLEVDMRRSNAHRSGTKPIGDSIEHVLNEYGADGWELANVHMEEVEGRSYTYAFLKRPKQS